VNLAFWQPALSSVTAGHGASSGVSGNNWSKVLIKTSEKKPTTQHISKRK
jgi:hypothetical protein